MLVLGHIGWNAADLLVKVDEGDDGKEVVKITGMVDWEFAGIVPQWMVTGLPPSLLLLSSSDKDDDDKGQEELTTLPVWNEISKTWALPKARQDDHLAVVWQMTSTWNSRSSG
jgi:hypothetical protein